MASILLVHGAFRGGWSFGRVASRLAARGHDVHAPDLPGAGARWSPGLAPVGLEDVLDDLEALVVGRDLRDLVVVGHSQGGLVAQALTQRVADRLRLVAFLDAPVPVHGQRALDLQPPGVDVPPAPPRDVWVPPAPLDAEVLGVPTLVANRWTARLTPLSVAIALDPVRLDAPAAHAVDRRFAWCSLTPATFPAWHTRAAREAAGEADDVLDSPHDAPLARPDLVAEWVDSLP